MSGLTLPAAVARGRHWNPTPNHAQCERMKKNASSQLLKFASLFTNCITDCVCVSRYIICQGKRLDAEPIQHYLFALNERMCRIWPGVSTSNTDILEVVPYNILQQDEQFFQYIYDSNVRCVMYAVLCMLVYHLLTGMALSRVHTHAKTTDKTCIVVTLKRTYPVLDCMSQPLLTYT